MTSITYTFHWVWYSSRWYKDRTFKMPKCYLPDSSYSKIKEESETVTYTVAEAEAEVKRFKELKQNLEYKDRWDNNDYTMNNYYCKVIRDLEKLIREAE